MFRDLPQYEALRPSGLPWATEVPAHWAVERAKTVMTALDQRSRLGDEELLTVSSGQGVIPRNTTSVSMFQADSYVGHKLCWPGDLVINSLWAWSRGLGVSAHYGIVSTAYGVYRLRGGGRLLPGYLHQLVRSDPFQWELQVRSQGVWKSRLQMTDARWLDAPLLLPPPEEQAAIVKYLAHANARIDKAIAAKRRLIALLEEQRAAMAASALSNADGAQGRLKQFARIQTGLTLGKNYQTQGLAEYPYLRVANVQMGYINTSDVARVMVPEREAERVALCKGDVLMTEGGDVDKLGRGTVWNGSVEPCLHQNHVFAVRCSPGLLPEYLALWLTGPTSREYFFLTAKKTTNLASTNSTTVGALPITVPPVDVQVRILSDLASLQGPSMTAVSRTEREIALLQEFRTRLVADVVTGQVDVRAIAAALPEAPEDVAGSHSDGPEEEDAAAGEPGDE